MKRISFNRRFVNAAENDLVSGKIHTIRVNYDYWRCFEGKDLALFYWEGKPYRSKQVVFCVKRLISMQGFSEHEVLSFDAEKMAKNDGFNSLKDFNDWFYKIPLLHAGILHFTDFRY